MNKRRPIGSKVSIAVSVVLAAATLIAFSYIYSVEKNHLEETVGDKARRVLLALEANHTQAMIFRGHKEDGNPVIDAFNGSIRYLSDTQDNMDIWLFMGPKVADFQRRSGSVEIEPPRDRVDQQALDTGQPVGAYETGNIYRYSVPVVLGKGPADNPVCFSCHGTDMGVQDGEVIGGFSVAYNASAEFREFWTIVSRTAAYLALLVAATAGIIFWSIKKQVSGPLSEIVETLRRITGRNDSVQVRTPDSTESREIAELLDASRIFADFAQSKMRKLQFAIDEHAIVSITDVKGTIQFANEKFSEISGYANDELIGRNHRILKSGMHPPEFFEDLWRTISNGRSWRGDIKNIAKSGAEYWVASTIVPFINDSGKPYQYVAIRTDITSEKNREIKLLEATEIAQTASQAKSNFLSTMSHEIRTPLNGVLGLAQLLKDSNLDPEQCERVDTIISSGQTLLAIINDVLDMSRIEAGRIELEETAFVLNGLISTIATPFQSLADDKGLTLTVNDGVDSNLVVRGDAVRLRQILWNLLSNAIKFTDAGSVTLTIKPLPDSSERIAVVKDIGLQFTVRDTGTGIAAERVAAIFEPFTQEDNSISRKFGGTGLGLSIVRQLTELMGGSIEVQSQPGQGSAFDVYLPFTRASGKDVSLLASQNSAGVGKVPPLNILLAEDNEVNALIARAFLEKAGHRVTHVENGKQAVAAVQDRSVDFVLMDIHMPEMNGVDATRQIRASSPGKHLPIVGLTAEAFAERHAQFNAAGMDGVLTKPFTEQQLSDALQKYRHIRGIAAEKPDTAVGSGSCRPQRVKSGRQIENVASGAPTEEANELPVGDAAKLQEFRLQFDEPSLQALLTTARDSLQKDAEDLRSGLELADPDRIYNAAHSIKGACGSMAAVRISQLAAVMEQQSSDITANRALLPDFEKIVRQTIDWWRDQGTG